MLTPSSPNLLRHVIRANATTASYLQRVCFLCVLTAAVVHASIAAAATASDFLFDSIAKQGAEPADLPFRFLVPAGYNADNGPYPLIVFLHGSGERGTNNTAQLNNNANGALSLVSTPNQTQYSCFMLAPQANVAEGWNGNTLGQVVRAIAKLQATYAIDANRICVTGLSMGGFGTWDIARRYPFLFSAAVPMNGWGGGDYNLLVHLPLWAFHAANDGTVGVAGSDNAVSAVRQAGGRVIYTRYATGGHGIWPTAYSNPHLLPWMMAQRRNQPATGVPIVSVVSPGPGIAPPPGSASLTVTGTASMPGGITQVQWTTSPWVGAAGIDPTTYPPTAGTNDWTAASVPNSTQFLVVATGSSWATGTGGATGGGSTTVNDFLWKPTTSANLTPATVTISAPVTSGVYATTTSSIDLVGTAQVASPKNVQGVTWQNDRGGQGIARGTNAWSISGIDLQPGLNVITVTARDSHGITGITEIMVNAMATTSPLARLLNLSTRARAGTGDDVLIPGFVISGTGSKRLLIRAVGPTLGEFGVTDMLADPQLTLKVYDPATQTYSPLASNDDWSTNANAAAITTTASTFGAFALNANSTDAALLVDLPPGQYSAVAEGKNGGTGVAIVELYDADAGTPTSQLINLSNRGFVGVGGNLMIPGFVVSSEGAKTLLIRAVGPTLAGFGVSDALADPQLQVYRRISGTSTDELILTNDDWDGLPGSATTASVAQQVSAFPLAAGSKDAALVVTLAPGTYTVHASGVSNTAGTALVEIYIVP